MVSDGHRIGVALALLASVAACREGVEVLVTQDANDVTFTVDPIRKSFDACVDRIYVYAGGEQADRELWYSTRGMNKAPCTKAIRYGAPPAGFSGRNSAPRLESGKEYRAALLGPGFNESVTFRRR